MDLLSYFRVLRRRWVLILVCAVAGGALGAATTLLDSSSPTRTYYKATHTMVVEGAAGGGGAGTGTTGCAFTLPQMAILTTTGDVPVNAAKALGSSIDGHTLAERITTTTNSVTDTLDVTAVDASPKAAVALADGFANELKTDLDKRCADAYAQEQNTLNQQLASLQNQSNGYLTQIRQVPPPPNVDIIQRQYDATQNQYYATFLKLQSLASNGVPTSGLSTLEPAQSVPISSSEYSTRLSLGELGQNHLAVTATTPNAGTVTAGSSSSSFDSPASRGVLGALLGFIVGVGLAFLAERLDRKIRTHLDAETAFGLPVLAEVPQLTPSQEREGGLVAVTAPLSRAAEAYRAIRTSVLFQRASVAAPSHGGHGNGDGVFDLEHSGPLVIMVTSSEPREGKTTTSANLGAVFAEAGSSVLVVNCDFRRPTIHKLFGLDDIPRRVQESGIEGVKVVTNVVPDPGANPAQVVAAQRQVINAARGRFDVIVLDTAPLLTANDAVELVASADLLLLVARSGVTGVDDAQRAMDLLSRLEAPVGGVVLVGSVSASTESYYYYQPGRLQQDAPRNQASGRRAARANGGDPDGPSAVRRVQPMPDDELPQV
jgi:Mrp family chromosome partitioning ATPase/capsular polysaccharide biosynthesis protein